MLVSVVALLAGVVSVPLAWWVAPSPRAAGGAGLAVAAACLPAREIGPP